MIFKLLLDLGVPYQISNDAGYTFGVNKPECLSFAVRRCFFWVAMSRFFDWLPIKETHIISLNLTAISSSTWVFALVSLVLTSGIKPSYLDL